MATQIDPVCGMQVDEKKSAAQSEYQGQIYYFCSQGCKAKFDQNPQQYARGTGQTQTSKEVRPNEAVERSLEP